MAEMIIGLEEERKEKEERSGELRFVRDVAKPRQGFSFNLA